MSDQKQSQFIEVNSLIDSDYVPVFGQGTNRKISKPNLITQIKDETSIFIYPTIEQLQAADLIADPDFPIYVRVEENGYSLYKITSLAPLTVDISLDNGTTASFQNESSKVETAATYASLALIPGKVGQIITIGCHTSGTIGGGQFIGVAGSVTNDGGTQINSATVGIYWKRINYAFLTFAMFGAQGDGTTDDTAAINYGLAKNFYINGENKIYAVTGDIVLPVVHNIADAEFKQLSPSSSTRKTLSSTSCTFSRLRNIKVNRNGDGNGGGLTTGGGIFFNSGDNIKHIDLEVYGNDYGNGIAYNSCTNVKTVRPYVHDIRAGDASAAVITDDKVQGIWVNSCTHVKVVCPDVRRMRCQWSGQASTPRFTRGLCVGGSSNDVEIHDSYIYSADQLIDISGDIFPTRVKVIGGYLLEGATYGLKCANSPTHVTVIGATAEKCGASGFIASAPSGALSTMTSKIEYIGCKAIGTGYSTGGAAATKVGFRCTNSAAALNTPSEVRFIDCVADDDGLGLMEYGFLNDAGSNTFNTSNQAINCRSIGHTTRAVTGFSVGRSAYVQNRYYGGGFINPANTATLTIIANTLYAIPFEVKWHSEWAEINFVVQTLAAGSARVGIYSWDNGVPTTLLLDAGTVSVNTTGTKAVTISPAKYLEPGIYALAFVSDVAPIIYCSTATVQSMEVTGVTTPGTTAPIQITRALTYGALPSSFGAVTYSALNLPNLMMRPS